MRHVKKSFVNTTEGLFDVKQDRYDRQNGFLGMYSEGGDKVVEVPGRPGFVYVRLIYDLSSAVVAYNNAIAPVWGIAVEVERTQGSKGYVWKVLGGSADVVSNVIMAPGTAFLPSHGLQHSFNLSSTGTATGADPVWVYKNQFMPLNVTPSSPISMRVTINADSYVYGDDVHYFATTGSVDFTSLIPGTLDNQARFMTVCLNMATNGLEYITGSLVDMSTVITDPYTYIAAPTTENLVPLKAIILTSGMVAIKWPNLYDIRTFLKAGVPTHTHTESGLVLSDVLINDATTLRHGFLPKLPGPASQYLGGDGGWHTVTTGSSTTFLGLTDTPDSYTGSAGRLVAVKGDETGLDFFTNTGTSALPGGANTQIQFNDSGVLNGDSNLTWNKATQLFTTTHPSFGSLQIQGGIIFCNNDLAFSADADKSINFSVNASAGATTGGSITFDAGWTVTGTAGDVRVNAGSTYGGGIGGNVILQAGYTVGGTSGQVRVMAGDNIIYAGLRTLGLTSSRLFDFPDEAGIFALGTGTAGRVPNWNSGDTLGDSNLIVGSASPYTLTMSEDVSFGSYITNATSFLIQGTSGNTIVSIGIKTSSNIIGHINISDNKTLAVVNNASIAGTNTGDQTITLTGAVTGSGAGSFATTFATPGTLTVATTNSNVDAHTHAITSSANPGAAASILATDASGNLTIAGQLNGSNTTDSSSTTTGAIITAGGLGVAKAIFGGSTLKLNPNATALVAGFAGTTVQLAQVDSTNNRVLVDAYAAIGILDFRRADTSAASKSALAAADIIGIIAGSGYGSTGYGTTAPAQIRLVANQTWTDANQGTNIQIYTSANNTAAAVLAATFGADKSLAVVGSVNVGGDTGGVAASTTFTNATNATVTNTYIVRGGQAANTVNTGWIKIFIGTNAAWIPYWQNATP